jgi:SAM-dependent methyltransferase
MSFEVPADAYARFMGRYADPLAPAFAAYAGVAAGQRALDVGCGPGTLTAVLVRVLGADAVAAIDPSPPFVAAARARFPEVDVREGVAEDLPWPDASFDLVTAQLVVHFMSDPVTGLREMRRVTAPGGTVAACVWDHAGGRGPLSTFWRAVSDLDPGHPGESDLPGTREGHLVELATSAGWADAIGGTLSVTIPFASVDDWWEPYTFGVGPAGEYVARRDEAARARLRERCAALLPPAPFEQTASAWCVRATG